jgi:hypothetical protein
MNSGETGRKRIRTRRLALGKKRQARPSVGKPSNTSLDALSGDALIEALRGSYKGKASLVAARERDHKQDEHAKSRKLAAIGR